MLTQTLTLLLDERRTVSAVLNRPDVCRPGETPGLVLAHGMNNDLDYPLLATVAHHLAESGTASTIRFNFAYRERGSSSPDRPEILELAFRRAHDQLVDHPDCGPARVFLGGKSLGARVAAELASRGHEGEGLLAAGLVFLGYPLHAPGRKDSLRLAPLRSIAVPSLFVQGSRDPFCDLELLRPVVEGLELPGRIVEIQGGGHSYESRRSGADETTAVHEEVADIVAHFIREHSPA